MSPINLATQIPSNIVTLEQLHLWSGLALSYVNPTIAVLETANDPQKALQTQLFRAADDLQYSLVRATIKMDGNYVFDRTKKLWMFAQDFSNVAIPAGFSAN